jgi:hypothetical protein
MALVPVTLRLINPDDPYRRQVLMAMDKVPSTSWQKSNREDDDKTHHREFIQSGGTTRNTFDIPDGKHVLYVAVGMDESQGLGAWSGVGDIGGVQRPIDRVDFDTLAKFDFTVKGGKVLDSSKTEASPKGTPSPTQQGGEEARTGPTGVGTQEKVKDMWSKIIQTLKDHKVETVSGSAVVGVVLGAMVLWKKKHRY